MVRDIATRSKGRGVGPAVGGGTLVRRKFSLVIKTASAHVQFAPHRPHPRPGPSKVLLSTVAYWYLYQDFMRVISTSAVTWGTWNVGRAFQHSLARSLIA